MYRQTCLLTAALAIAPGAVAQSPLQEARTRYLKGNYAEAREIYEKHKAAPTEVAIGLSQCDEAVGEVQKALDTIDAALNANATSAKLHARRAELLYARGDWDAALASVAAALKIDEEQFAARWVRAQIVRDRGDDDAADTELRWFVRTYVARNRAGKDIKNPDELIIVGLAGAENARRHSLTDQFRFILNEVFADALKAEPNYWQAEHQAGQLLLEKYNKAESLAAFDKALAINPRAAPALVGKGQIALQHFAVAEAERFAERALEINPKQSDALLLLADIALACGDDKLARERLQAAQVINPRNEAVLGRLAALAKLKPGAGPAFDELRKSVESFDPKPGRFFFELGRRLDERRHYDDAREAYLQAVAMSPRLTAAKTELGMLALRMGDEPEAKKLLTEAFKSDPFHVRLSNSLKVLRHLETYETIRTDHFIVRFDGKLEPVLGRLVVDLLEREYDRQSLLFNHRPPGPFLVEVFTNHEMFSGRIIAAPDLHTVGATTGRTFAFTSPQAKGIKKTFNWARVVRHELTHIFNLDQTRFQVPHWLTEGLAVTNEGYERPADWLRILADYARRNELFNLTTLDAGFIRPHSHETWTLAYCQANLYVEYLTKTYGQEIVGKLLTAFRNGAETPAAITSSTGAELSGIESGYKKYVLEILKASGAQPIEKQMTLAQLEVAHAKEPDDPATNAKLAEQYLRRKRNRDALEHANAALAKEPKNTRALAVKGMLRLEAGDEEAALPLLEAAAAGDNPDLKALRAVGKIHHQANRFDEALTVFERGHKLEPVEPSWLEEIAKAAKQAGDVDRSIRATMELLLRDPDEIGQRKELAQSLADLGRHALAERYAREVIEIDPTDTTAQDLLLAALLEQKKADELARWRKLLGRPAE